MWVQNQNENLLEEFISYSLQDAKSLYEALHIAQLTYFAKFKVDIDSVYSTATFSLKIYFFLYILKKFYNDCLTFV